MARIGKGKTDGGDLVNRPPSVEKVKVGKVRVRIRTGKMEENELIEWRKGYQVYDLYNDDKFLGCFHLSERSNERINLYFNSSFMVKER